jgi:chromosomal replication initiator protein
VSEHQMNLAVVWDQVVRELSNGTLSPQQRAWMRVTRPIGLLDGTALLAAPSDFAKEAIERALREPITRALSRRLGRPISLAVKVDTAEVEVSLSPPTYSPPPVRVRNVPAELPPMMPPMDKARFPPIRSARAQPAEPILDEESDEDGDELAAAHEIWPMFSGRPAAGQPYTAPAQPQTSKTRLNEKYNVRGRGGALARVQPVVHLGRVRSG